MSGHDDDFEDYDVEIHNDDDDGNESDENLHAAESASDGGVEASDAVRSFLRKSKPHRSAPPPTTCEKSMVSFPFQIFDCCFQLFPTSYKFS